METVMENRKFAVLILSHGRADHMYTLDTLHECGYTGDWYIVVDNEDPTVHHYIEKFGEDHIIIFDKAEAAKKNDTCDIVKSKQIVLHARNECFRIASELGLTHFLELDDDYVEFRTRYEDGDKLRAHKIKHIDDVIEAYLDFLDTSGALTVAWAQGGDFIGGIGAYIWRHKYKRKAMNAFFCRTDRPFYFMGRINEDVNMYCTYGQRGYLILTTSDVVLNQVTTQANASGLTDVYLELGTYVKSFYTVITNPNCSKIMAMVTSNTRIHHMIQWEYCCPKIISDRFKK